MDLDEIYARRAAGLGIPLVIDTDAHEPDQMGWMEYGVSVARRAWLGPAGVLNTWPVDQLLAWLQRAR